jgi:hypothetical protein
MATARRQLGYVSQLTIQTSPLMSYGTATGGTSSSITVSSVDYTLLTFTGDATMTVTRAGLFEVLCIGAGGGGYSPHNTGGGGGGWQTGTFYCDANVSIVVGAGGANSSSVVGGSSRFGDFIASAGGGSQDSAVDTSLCGASTGGSRSGVPTRNNIVGQGTGGTTGRAGCGAGAASIGDTGGAGKQVNTFIGGSSLLLANGGAGGASGNGGANTGNGAASAGTGGSGVVYVRFKV